MESLNASYEFLGQQFSLKLSSWDQRFPPMYSKRLLFFSFPSSSEADVSELVASLRAALQLTVDEVPLLSGKVTVNKEASWLYDIQQGSKVSFVVKDLRSELDFQALRRAGFPSAELDAKILCDYPKPMYLEQSGVPVCILRLNLLGGNGISLVLQIAHTVCDGAGVSSILDIFIKHLRGNSQTASSSFHQMASKAVGSEDRTRFAAGSLSHDSIADHPAWKYGPVTGSASLEQLNIQCWNLFINEKRLSELKALSMKASGVSGKVSSQSSRQPTWISTHDAVCGFIWKTLIAARHKAGLLDGKEETHFTTAVDCRKRLGLQEPYLGNVIDAIRPSLPMDVLKSSTAGTAGTADTTSDGEELGLGSAATAIRSAIASITAESFRGLVDCVQRTSLQLPTRLTVMDSLQAESVMVISFFHFRAQELDFGEQLGKPEACRLGHGGMIPGITYILPRRLGPDGGCEIIVNEPPEVLEALAQNQLFTRFVEIGRGMS